jgi:amidohydrolase
MIRPEQVKKIASHYFEKAVAIRRQIHSNPELSFQEFRTAEYISSQLGEFGIAHTTGHAGTGVVALLKGKDPESRTLLMRADMDALPIEEKNDVPYRSCKPGIMHACGHDVHTACLLGAAFILNEMRDQWKGTIKLMFQPGEEVLPGGASLMIRDGVLEDPKVEKAIALHVLPSMPAGHVGFREGIYMSSTDELHLTVKGKGGHAAMVAEYKNPVLAVCEIIGRINEAFMTSGAQQELGVEGVPIVAAFGKLDAAGATNVIPEVASAAGTFRTMDESVREKAHGIMKQIAASVSASHRVEADLEIRRGYPVLFNDPAFTAVCRTAAQELLGKSKVEELPLRMTAEDFAFITQEVPSCFFRLGTGNKGKGITSPVHTATFDVDESAIETGMALLAWIAVQ